MHRAALLCIFAAAATCASARAESVVYSFAALRGDVSTCQWFDDNLNDRSEAALVRQIALIYNRVALPAGAQANVTQIAATQAGTPLLGFTIDRTQLCAAADAIRPTPIPSASPAAAP
jgi:hypothetical protein